MHPRVLERYVTEILRLFEGRERGHCVRIDHFTPAEADALCTAANARIDRRELTFAVLHAGGPASDFAISADQAIELRNRKTSAICLFVPSDVIDSAASSLTNSFAPVDGARLQRTILQQMRDERSFRESAGILAEVNRHSKKLDVSDAQRLAFLAELHDDETRQQLASAGRHLPLIGLLPDHGEDFRTRLEKNQASVLALARPRRSGMNARERVAALQLKKDQQLELLTVLRDRPLSQPTGWLAALSAQPELSFDRWRYDIEESDLCDIVLEPFLDAKGVVKPFSKLTQDAPGDALIALYGVKKAALEVRWKTKPLKPLGLKGWKAEIVPVNPQDSLPDGGETPSVRVAAGKRKAVIKLEKPWDEPPVGYFRVRLLPLAEGDVALEWEPEQAADGREIEIDADGAVYSDEFLLQETDEIIVPPPVIRPKTVPTLALGRIEAALNGAALGESEAEPRWSNGEAPMFDLEIAPRRKISLSVSGLLRDLQLKTLDEPASGGRYLLQCDDDEPAPAQDWQALDGFAGVVSTDFQRARKRFFKALSDATPRHLIEVADWNDELVTLAVDYAAAYRKWLSNIGAGQTEALGIALSIDTILVRDEREGDALVVLPTHPLRALWFAAYSRLLRSWEAPLSALSASERTQLLDLEAVRLLTPINIPAFVLHPLVPQQTFVFYQNLQVFHGIALPISAGGGAPAVDPQRRSSEIGRLLGLPMDAEHSSDRSPQRLAGYLKAFLEQHPYSDPLLVNLLNAEGGDLLSGALRSMVPQDRAGNDDEETVSELPDLRIRAYVRDTAVTAISGIDELRAQYPPAAGGRHRRGALDPRISTMLRHFNDFTQHSREGGHLAVTTDLAQTAVVTHEAAELIGDGSSSFALYGLVVRFITQLQRRDDAVAWRAVISDGGQRAEEHPSGLKLHELTTAHVAYLQAVGRMISEHDGRLPAVQVSVNSATEEILNQLHENNHWVITFDRFFALDYFDSPHDGRISEVARRYLLDYTPQFADGIGHRMLVTTAWREEIEQQLERGMRELGLATDGGAVERMLNLLKTVSGRLALRVNETTGSAARAIASGLAVGSFLEAKRLQRGLLLPYHAVQSPAEHAQAGSAGDSEHSALLLVQVDQRQAVVVTVIDVTLRRGSTVLEQIFAGMTERMKRSGEALRARYFDPARIDAALQRAHFATALRHHLARAVRYGVINLAERERIAARIQQIEREPVEIRLVYEGILISLDQDVPKLPIGTAAQRDEAQISFISAQNVAERSGFRLQISGERRAERAIITSDEDARDDDDIVFEADTYRDEDVRSDDVVHSDDDLHRDEDIRSDDDSVDEDTRRDEDDQTVRVILGDARNRPVTWRPGVEGSPHLFILGIPGQGKSYATTRIMLELARQGVPSLVFDYHGSFADVGGDYARRVSTTILRADEGLPFSPFEVVPESDGRINWIDHSEALAEIIGYIGKMGDMQTAVLRRSIQDAYRARNYHTAAEGEALPPPTADEILQFIEKNQNQKGLRVQNVSERARQFLSGQLFRPADDSFNLVEQARRGMVIDLHRLATETQMHVASAFILRRIYRDMFRWGPAERLRLAIVLDEAHRLANDVTLPKLMKESRKYGILVVVASQELKDFRPEVLNNTGTKVMFRMNYPESRTAAKYLTTEVRDAAGAIQTLQKFTAYVQTPEMPHALVTQMRALED